MDENSFIWTNGHILVKDDPNLIDYFGTYVLERVVERGKCYRLEIYRNRIKFSGYWNEKEYTFEEVRKWLNEDATKHRRLHVPKMLVSPKDLNGIGLSVEGNRDYVFTDKDYFDYLEGMGYDQLHLVRGFDVPLIYFLEEKETKSILAPLKGAAEVEIKEKFFRDIK